MKLRILSDLHLDYCDEKNIAAIKPLDEDLVLCAGDLSNTSTKGLEWLVNLFAPTPILFVPGNHEHYGSSIQAVEDDLINYDQYRPHVGVLQNKAVTINGYKFIGSTFWTNFNLYGPIGLWSSMNAAEKYVNDFRKIKLTEMQYLKARDVVEMNRIAEKFIDAELKDADPAKTVLLTHFATNRKSVHEMYAGDICTPYFVSDMPQWINKCALMVHGHCHTKFDYSLGSTRVICNPSGYKGERSGFDPNLIVEI
jgi:Icc-related predicted phosphoesterase